MHINENKNDKIVLKSKLSKPKFKKYLYVFLLTIVGVFGDKAILYSTIC